MSSPYPKAFPRVVLVRQRLATPRVGDVAAHLHRRLDEFGLDDKVKPGARVALTAGSRGIRDLPLVLRELAGRLAQRGAQPFIVPCMGSHGGATAEGQAGVLADLGVTEESVGAPLVSSMEVAEVGRTPFGTPVLVGRDLIDADGVVVVNRVKPHTDFRGEVESGLVKMLVIGMGKHEGALLAHRLTIRHGFPAVLAESARVVLARLPVLAGVALVENGRDETANLEAIGPGDFFSREADLLRQARELMPRLPFTRIDILVVDELGKDISGAGMDTNVIGRMSAPCGDPPPEPRITRIYVRDLSAASHGNAVGIGMADFVSTRMLAKVDRAATDVNAITSMAPEDARLPAAFDRDDDALAAAQHTCGVLEPRELRMVWIRNTLALEHLCVSEALLDEARAMPNVEILDNPEALPIGADGNLVPPWH